MDLDKAAVLVQKNLRGIQARRKTLREMGEGHIGGFIKVCVRVRPLGEGRGERGDNVNVDPRLGRITVKSSRRGKSGDEQVYDFERVSDESDNNESIARSIGQPIVEQVCTGYNGTLFAYGQTGSGKTYTIGEMAKLGTEHEGVAHRMVRQLYVEAMSMRPKSFKVTVTFVQIYVENCHDLLTDPERGGLSSQSKLQLREDKIQGVYVEGATSIPAATAEECLNVMAQGTKNLMFAATKMNRHSSRSHAVCRLLVEIHHGPGHDHSQHGPPKSHDALAGAADALSTPSMKDLISQGKNAVDGGPSDLKKWRRRSIQAISAKVDEKMITSKTTKATLTLCDLAGSEDVGRSGATGSSLAEAQKINTSLLALGNVIQALTTSGNQHVPFRNSVLTRILQQSIGGNCKTCLIVCASPADGDVTETLSTLRFASRAKRVKNVAKINATIEASAVNTEEFAESLQSHLDAEKEKLEAARVKSEEVAANAISIALKLGINNRRVQRQMEALHKEQDELRKAKEEALHQRDFVMQNEEKADEEREAMEGELGEAKAKLEEMESEIAAMESKLSAAEEAAKKAEKEAKQLKEVEVAQAKKEASELRTAHQAELEELNKKWTATVAKKEKEVEASAASKAAQREKEIAAEISSREAELAKLVASAAEASKDADGQQRSFRNLISWQRAGQSAASTRWNETAKEAAKAAKEAEEAAKATAAAELAAAVEAARVEERNVKATELREAQAAHEKAQAAAVEKAVELAVERKGQEMRDAFNIERSKAVTAAKSEGRQQAEKSAAERQEIALRAAETKLKSAVSAAETAAAAAQADVLLKAKRDAEAALEEALVAEQDKARTAKDLAVASAIAQAQAEAQAEVESAAYEAKAAHEAKMQEVGMRHDEKLAEAAQQLAAAKAERDLVTAGQKSADEACARARADAEKALTAASEVRNALEEAEAKAERLEKQLESARKEVRDGSRNAALRAEEVQASVNARIRREAEVREEYTAALAQNAAAAQAREAELQRKLQDAEAEARVAAEVAASELAAEKQRMYAEARQEQSAAVEKARNDASREFDARVQDSLNVIRSETANEVDRHLRLRREAEAEANTLREELAKARDEVGAVMADAKSAERRHSNSLQAASSRANSEISESVAAAQARMDVEMKEAITARESEVRAEMAVAIASTRAMVEAEAQAAVEVMSQSHAARVAELENGIAAARSQEQRLSVEKVAPLEHEIARLTNELEASRAAGEAAAAKMRMELRVARDAAAQRATGLDATIEKLKSAHNAAIVRVRGSHDAALNAERHARSEAENKLNAIVEQQRLTSDEATNQLTRLRDVSVEEAKYRAQSSEIIRELEREIADVKRLNEQQSIELAARQKEHAAFSSQMQQAEAAASRVKAERDQLHTEREAFRGELSRRELLAKAAAANEASELLAKVEKLERRVQNAEAEASAKAQQLAQMHDASAEEVKTRTRSSEAIRDLERQLEEVKRHSADRERLLEVQKAELMTQLEQSSLSSVDRQHANETIKQLKEEVDEQRRLHERQKVDLMNQLELASQSEHQHAASRASSHSAMQELERQLAEQRRLHESERAEMRMQLESQSKLLEQRAQTSDTVRALNHEIEELGRAHERQRSELQAELQKTQLDLRSTSEMYSRMQQDLAQTSRQAAENESRYVQLEQALARSEMQSQSARAERDELQKSAERLRSEASAIQKDAQSAMSQLETRFAETSRRMIAEKEELASDRQQAALERSRLAAENSELSAKADHLARRVMDSEHQIASEQHRSLDTLRKLSELRSRFESTQLPSPPQRTFGYMEPVALSTQPSSEPDRYMIRSPALHESPSYYAWHGGLSNASTPPAPASVAHLNTPLSTSSLRSLPAGPSSTPVPRSTIYAVSPEAE